MTDNGVDIGLTVPIYVDADIEVDDHDICNIVTLIYVGDDEECYEARVALDVIVDGLIETFRDTYSYNQLYVIAHELSRQAERLRSVGNYIEDSTTVVSNLFDIDE